VIKRSDEDPTQTLKHVQIVSNEKWTQGFGLREIVIMNELKKRAPMHLRKAVVSVDILKDSAEEVLHVVTGCFAAATGNLPELGLRGAEIGRMDLPFLAQQWSPTCLCCVLAAGAAGSPSYPAWHCLTS
jgi:hypothetical protein